MSTIQILWTLVAAQLLLMGMAWTAAIPMSRALRGGVVGLVAFNLVMGVSLMLIGFRDELPYFVGHTFSNVLSLWALVAVIQAADQLLKIQISQREIWLVLSLAGLGILGLGLSHEMAVWRVLVLFIAICWMLARTGWKVWQLPIEPHLRMPVRSIGGIAMALAAMLLIRAVVGVAGHASIEFSAEDGLTLLLPFLVLAGVSLVNLGFAYLAVSSVVMRLRQLARSDELTGLLNRKALVEEISLAWSRFAKSRESFALICLDVDNLRAVNAVHGYVGGDAVLKKIVEALRGVLRPGDAMGRAGGGKMVALLPNTDLDGVRDVAALMQSNMTGLRLRLADLPREVSVSMGVAVSLVSDANDEAVLARANAQLAAAKAAGRNRVVWMGPDTEATVRPALRPTESDALSALNLTPR
jgi:diguanylate cyclase (GGDEF)-like protein